MRFYTFDVDIYRGEVNLIDDRFFNVTTVASYPEMKFGMYSDPELVEEEIARKFGEDLSILIQRLRDEENSYGN